MPAKSVKTQHCPECRSASVEAFRPFCSKRCADIDLARWLTGGYAIPAADAAGDADDDSPSASDSLPN